MLRVLRPLPMSMLAISLVTGCAKSKSDPAPAPSATTMAASAAPSASEPAPVASARASSSASGSPVDAGAPTACPEGETLLPAGIYWMGSTGTNDEESPRHRVALRSFCMDTYEVSVGAYAACTASGKCTPAHPDKAYCNAARKEVDDHPINCIDWNQAKSFCESRGERLPTEREWEYAARGGQEQRPFSWGSELPPGHSCYNHPGTCKQGSYAAGAFGLYDVTGNLWEWTDSWFAPYPDEATAGNLKVYRGGSFSRRFPKWMRNALRNRYRPDEWGAHLGARCAKDLAGSPCPAGSHDAEHGGGCVVDGEKESAPTPTVHAPSTTVESAASSAFVPPPKEPMTTTRDPQFDDDCIKWKPGRKVAYLIKGGDFADRQKSKGGCVNRDVGVGFNSVCCAN